MSMFLQNFLGRIIRVGNLEVETASGAVFKLGDGSGPPVAVRFADSAAQLRLLSDPEMAFGELYMDQRLIVTKGTIFDALMLGTRNVSLDGQPKWLETLSRLRSWTRRLGQRNTLLNAKRNVEAHYDIDGRIYDLFLDRDRQYSCAYFEHPGELARRRATGQETPYRREAFAEAGSKRAGHWLRLGRPRFIHSR